MIPGSIPPGPFLMGSACLQRAHTSCFSMLKWQGQVLGLVVPALKVSCLSGQVCLPHLANKHNTKSSNSFCSYASDT